MDNWITRSFTWLNNALSEHGDGTNHDWVPDGPVFSKCATPGCGVTCYDGPDEIR